MRIRAGLGAILLALFAAGCAINPNGTVSQFAANSGRNSFEVFDRDLDDPNALVLPVVHDRQTAGPSCGAHALASVVNYWNGAGAMDGQAVYSAHPPQTPSGYSMTEVMTMARERGLITQAVRLDRVALIAELERGRPVMIPVRLPSIYVQQRVLPGGEVPVLGVARNAVISRTARVSEFTSGAMVNHYLLVVGHGEDRFVVIEPVMGYRTISFERLERYREAFGNAAIVFSGQGPPRGRAAAS